MYDESLLSIEKEDAQTLIERRVLDATRRVRNDRIEYRTNAGVLLASLTDYTFPSGARGSKLRYRTALVSGHYAHSRTLADEIRRAVATHVVE